MNKHGLSSSESEHSFDNEDCDAASENLHTDSGDEVILVVNSVVNPYENEPLASAVGEHFVSVEEDADALIPRHWKQDSKEQLHWINGTLPNIANVIFSSMSL